MPPRLKPVAFLDTTASCGRVTQFSRDRKIQPPVER